MEGPTGGLDRRRVLGLLLALLLVGLAGLALEAVTPRPAEQEVVEAIAAGRSPGRTLVAHVVTRLADLWLVLLGAAAVALLAGRTRFGARIRLLVLVTVGGTLVLVTALKLVTARPRPTGGVLATLTSAYPSGHALRAATVFGLAAWLCHRYVRRAGLRVAGVITCLVLVAAIGWSRLYLGVHWPSDVLAGTALGLVWLAVVLVVLPPPRAGAGGSRGPSPSPERPSRR